MEVVLALFVAALISVSPQAFAEVSKTSIGSKGKGVEIRFDLKSVKSSKVEVMGRGFESVSADDLPNTNDVGAPRLPFYAAVFAASPEQLLISATLGKGIDYGNLNLEPAQEEDCRCDDAKNRAKLFVNQVASYVTPKGNVRIESLGDFRGSPMTRVLFYPHDYAAGRLKMFPKARFTVSLKRGVRAIGSLDITASLRKAARENRDYLVVAPTSLSDALAPWIEHKRARGYTMRLVTFAPGTQTALSMQTLIADQYRSNPFGYALLVGSRAMTPSALVQTSASASTPSDLPYFTFGGSDDIVPDVFAGRLIAESSQQVARIVRKWIYYETDTNASQGWRSAIGVASDEGSNPSDNEYVLSMQQKIQEKFGTEFSHFYQRNADSNPQAFNAAMSRGAMWMTYLGHGSGTSWPSFQRTYSKTDIAGMANENAVKPIWIDVACQNGNLTPSNAGATLAHQASNSGAALGVTAYYGGTVNISWHPPAVLARGIVFRMVDQSELILGEMIQEGHVYLSENNSNPSDLRDNQRWYTLQGDPSLAVRLQ